MRSLIPLLSIALLTMSCKSTKEELHKPNERLLYFSTKTIMEIDQLNDDEYYSINSDEFNDKTDTIRFTNDEIYISYLSLVTGCANYSGDMQIKGDSIILDPFNTNDIVCTEQSCDRVVFRIKNKGNKKYKIKKW
jgi:hypothetical protein